MNARTLIETTRAAPGTPRFVALLEAGTVPRDRLRVLAAQLARLVESDRRSFALLASRFPDDLFLAMADGEREALRLLGPLRDALGDGDCPPVPLAEGYPAYLARAAQHGTRSDVALSLLANAAASGDTYRRIAAALHTRYGLPDAALAHFHWFAETPPEMLAQAEDVLAAGLASGDDPAQAATTATTVAVFEELFWDAMAQGLR